MEIFSASLAICAGNSSVSGEFPAQRPVTRSFDVFFDLRLNKRLSKQSWGWWFKTLSRPIWRHRNVVIHVLTSETIQTKLPLKLGHGCLITSQCFTWLIIDVHKYTRYLFIWVAIACLLSQYGCFRVGHYLISCFFYLALFLTVSYIMLWNDMSLMTGIWQHHRSAPIIKRINSSLLSASLLDLKNMEYIKRKGEIKFSKENDGRSFTAMLLS